MECTYTCLPYLTCRNLSDNQTKAIVKSIEFSYMYKPHPFTSGVELGRVRTIEKVSARDRVQPPLVIDIVIDRK